jgi:hypothetical protein
LQSSPLLKGLRLKAISIDPQKPAPNIRLVFFGSEVFQLPNRIRLLYFSSKGVSGQPPAEQARSCI